MSPEKNTALLSRINSPELSPNILPRARLLNLLSENNDKKLIIVCSPAGYGKTTLILNHLTAEKQNYSWVNIPEDLSHVYSFINLIILSLQKLNPEFGKDTLSLMDAEFEKNRFAAKLQETVNSIVITFRAEFNKCFIGKVSLVLDDYHHSENYDWKDFTINALLRNIPDNLRIIITSRQLPELDLAYYISNNMLLKIEMEELVFNAEETRELVLNKYAFESSSEKIDEMTAKLGGWVTGLQFMLQGCGNNLDNIIIDEQPIPENVFNSLAEKIFSNLDAGTRELLLVSSLIENFEADLMTGYLEQKNFRSIIDKLLKDFTFVITVPMRQENGPLTISYNYPSLFRNFLRAKLYSLRSGEEIRNILRNTYRFYDERKDTITAINYMIQAEDHKMALEKIEASFSALFTGGRIEFLWNWFNAIEPELTGSDPAALINFGILKKFYEGDLDSAADHFDKAIEMLSDGSNNKLLVQAYINKAGVSQNLGKTSEVIKDFKSLVNNEAYSEYKEALQYQLAYALFHSSQYLESEKILNGILNRGKPDKKILNSANKLLGHINLIKGDYLKAVSFYEAAVKDEKNILDKFEVLCNMTLLFSQSAQYSKAENYFNELEELSARFPTQVLKIPFLLAKQSYLFELGEFDEALKVMMEIYEMALELNHKQYCYLSSRLITECYYYKRDRDNAAKYYEYSGRFLDPGNEMKKIERGLSGLIILNAGAIETETQFLEAYDYYKANSLLYSRALACYHLAFLYFRNGLTEKAKKYLEECIEISRDNGYNSFLKREFKYDGSMIENMNISEPMKIYADQLRGAID